MKTGVKVLVILLAVVGAVAIGLVVHRALYPPAKPVVWEMKAGIVPVPHCPYCDATVSPFHEECPECDRELLWEGQEERRRKAREAKKKLEEGLRRTGEAVEETLDEAGDALREGIEEATEDMAED